MNRIIDMHTHTFPDSIAARTIDKLEKCGNIKAYTDGTLDGLKQEMKNSGVNISVILPVVTNPAHITTINKVAYDINEKFGDTGIWSFGGIHPDNDYVAELKVIAEYGLKGIKLHPDYQGTFFDDIRYKRIIDKACELGLIISVHAGLDIGLPDPIHCTPERVLNVTKELHPDKLVLAHMGGYSLWNDVLSELCGSGVYIDTAFCFDKSCEVEKNKEVTSTGKIGCCLFERFVKEYGHEKILFATDSPWGGQIEMLSAIKSYGLENDVLEDILYNNAAKLLNL